MIYALVENEVVTQIGLPQTGILKNGSTVSGYNLLDESVLLEEGWLPLVDIIPTHNADTEMAIQDGYTIEAAQVVVVYRIEAKPAHVPSLEEKIQQLEADKASLTVQLAQTNTDMSDFMDFVLTTLNLA